MAFDPLKPYNDLPNLPPDGDIETRRVLKKAIATCRALAELKGLGETIPDQGILINSIVLQEAKASSEIENIVTTNDALFRALTLASSSSVEPTTKEVLRYREALWTGYQNLARNGLLTTNVFVRVANTIKKNHSGIRTMPGTVLTNPATGDIIYTPPDGEDVIRGKLKNLEEYIHAPNGPDPLVKMAVVHYQFEAIHPFSDSNGRTGRILNILYLVQQGLLDIPVLYLSRYIIENKADYYRRIRAVTESGDWEAWILYILEAVEQTAIFTRKRILEIRSLLSETIDVVKERLPGTYSKELVELIFRHPYTKGQFLVDAGIAKRQTAATYLRALAGIGVLEAVRAGKEKIYVNVGLYGLLSK